MKILNHQEIKPGQQGTKGRSVEKRIRLGVVKGPGPNGL